jgi:hypothetical protein
MKIIRINLRALRNEEWFNFFTEFKTFVTERSPEALDIVELYALFLTLYVLADEALEKLLKSGYTQVIIDADAQRDDVFRGLTTAVQSASFHYDPVRREAATELSLVLDHYGNLAVRPYNEETAAIGNLIQDLRGRYAGAVQTLDLAGWVDELERRNNAFETAVLDRNRETAAKPDLNLRDLRRQINSCYLDIVRRIEAAILLRGEGAYADFVRTLNANIDRYRIALKRRSGKTSESESNDEL